MTAVNPWRGERQCIIAEAEVKLTCNMDQLAKVFSILEADSLPALYEKLETRHPDILEPVFKLLAGKEQGEAHWPNVRGIVGLAKVYSSIISTLSGQTPDEEAEAEKKQLAAQEAAEEKIQQRVMEQLSV